MDHQIHWMCKRTVSYLFDIKIDIRIRFATCYDLYDYYTQTVYVCLSWYFTFTYVLWCHVTTASQHECFINFKGLSKSKVERKKRFCKQYSINRLVTYGVPPPGQVLVFLSQKSFDRPKSASFGTIFSSSNMLAGFRSKWMMKALLFSGLHSSWR